MEGMSDDDVMHGVAMRGGPGPAVCMGLPLHTGSAQPHNLIPDDLAAPPPPFPSRPAPPRAVLAKRSFPPPHTARLVEAGYRDAPDGDSDMAIVFVKVTIFFEQDFGKAGGCGGREPLLPTGRQASLGRQEGCPAHSHTEAAAAADGVCPAQLCGRPQRPA